jgi:hypothetical protein
MVTCAGDQTIASYESVVKLEPKSKSKAFRIFRIVIDAKVFLTLAQPTGTHSRREQWEPAQDILQVSWILMFVRGAEEIADWPSGILSYLSGRS